MGYICNTFSLLSGACRGGVNVIILRGRKLWLRLAAGLLHHDNKKTIGFTPAKGNLWMKKIMHVLTCFKQELNYGF